MKITHENYLDGKVTHHQYYGHLVKIMGISFRSDDFHGYSLKDSFAIDEYLNNIPLKYWDALAMAFMGRGVPRLVRETIDPYFGSVSDYVCMAKEAARIFVTKKGCAATEVL